MQLIMDAKSLTAAIKAAALDLGFASVGVCPAATPVGWSHLRTWLERGFEGQVLDGVRSLVMLTLPYLTDPPREAGAGCGLVSRYAWSSSDYHELIHGLLRQLAARFRDWCPSARTRGVVDTAPLLERDLARHAGLGWIAKNTMLIDKAMGSWFFLAALLTDQDLEYDEPHQADHCGTCRACLDACPTQAFPEPYVLDARRCISYLTIELRGSVPPELRPAIGNWVFGCDICQEVCPWNRHGRPGDTDDFGPAGDMNPLPLAALFSLSDEEFRKRFRHTAIWRTKRRGMLRNAAIVLGNQRLATAIQPLSRGLVDPESVVRAACAWALGRIGGMEAIQCLTAGLNRETDAEVRSEIQSALADAESAAGSVP
jgi:epoxyqueuosine reductase